MLNILFVGFGAVARATCVLWNRILKLPIVSIVVIEPRDIPMELLQDLCENIEHKKIALTKRNLARVFGSIKTRLDLVIDLSINVDSVSVMKYFSPRGVPYISTAVETWGDEPTWAGPTGDPRKDAKEMIERSLAYKQQQIKAMFLPGTTTMLIDHGMNPGMISHFVKRVLNHIAIGTFGDRIGEIPVEKYPDDHRNGPYYAAIAKLAGITSIHCTEHDTQKPIVPRPKDVFFNTWSPKGFYEEATDPVQVGWGSHERPIPGMVRWHGMAFLPARGMDMKAMGMQLNRSKGKAVSYVMSPGYLIPHSENSTITNYLTAGDYRPSTYYVYRPSEMATESLDEIRQHHYKFQPRWHVLPDEEISEGYDWIAAWLFGRDRDYYGYTIVSKDQIKKYNQLLNTTTIQVACGVLSGIDWILRHPNMGAVWPESVDTDRVFQLTDGYIGAVIFSTHPKKITSVLGELINI